MTHQSREMFDVPESASDVIPVESVRRTTESGRVQLIRQLLLSEHAIQRQRLLASTTKNQSLRFVLVLGAHQSRRRAVIRSIRGRRRAARRRLRVLVRKFRNRCRPAPRRVLHRVRGHAPVGPDGIGSAPTRTFSDAERRKRRRLVNEFAATDAPRIDELRGAYAGQRCFILGNGPSLATQDLSPLADEHTFVTNWFANHPEVSLIRPSFYCICSHELFGGWAKPTPQFNNELRDRIESIEPTRMFLPYRFKPYVETAGLFQSHDRRYLIFDRPKMGIDEAGMIETDLHQPLHDGYTVIITFCLPLARWMGFTEIYLLGVDSDYGIAQENDPKQYFYDTVLHTSSTSKFESLQRIWTPGGPVFRNYEIVRRTFEREGISIVNLTRGGQLETFERRTYEEVVAP